MSEHFNSFALLPYYFVQSLRLWKAILYGDISYYQGKPDGTVFLTLKDSVLIAWGVWMT